jgi:type IV pilus assembly protein PilC
VQCLELLSKEEPDKRLAAAIDQVRTDVEAGSTLADAMQKRPYAFDTLFSNMIAAGEAGGILDTILSASRRSSRSRPSSSRRSGPR